MPANDPKKDPAGKPQPSAQELRTLALELIESTSTLTLATADETGPWSAPLYHVHIEEQFYFFSSPKSRHVCQAIATGRAAASIFAQGDDWQSIRGVQMQGRVEQVRSMPESILVLGHYLKRFAFVHDFFAGSVTIEPSLFFERFKVRLYRFSPSEVFYLDNRFGLGSRQPLPW